MRQEVEGGYLWSPKRETRWGKRNQFYDNMRIVAPGDKVLSFVKSHLGHVGVALDFAIGASKPPEFGDEGDYWSDEGWQLPVAWQPLPMQFRPKPLIAEFGNGFPRNIFQLTPRMGTAARRLTSLRYGRSSFAFW